MLNADNLRLENEKLVDLCGVLEVLLEKEDFCNNKVSCHLLNEFQQSSAIQLKTAEKAVSRLLRHAKTSDVANHFLNNNMEFKKILTPYLENWGIASGDEEVEKVKQNYVEFAKETKEIFGIVRDRVKLENEKLLPAVSKMAG